MKEYLTFDSVGGGSLVISEAGKYLLQLEDIIAVDGLIGGGGDIFSIWSNVFFKTIQQFAGSDNDIISVLY